MLGKVFFSDASGRKLQRRSYIAWRVWGISAIVSVAWAALWVDWNMLMLVGVAADAGVIRLSSSSHFQLWDSTVYSFGIIAYILSQVCAALLALILAITGGSSWLIALVFIGGWLALAFMYAKTQTLNFALLSCIATSGTLFHPRINLLFYAYIPSIAVIIKYESKSARYLLVFRAACALALPVASTYLL